MKDSRCLGCPFYDAPGPVPAAGPEGAKIMLVGESPSIEEVKPPMSPFKGPAGRVLNIAIKGAGLDRRSLYITNAVKCMGKPTAEVIERCRPFLEEELRRVRPNVVVAVGEVAFRALRGGALQEELPIMRWRGAVVETAVI